MTWLIAAAVYIAIPIIGILISGRKVTWQGWAFMILLWPIAWMFVNEELP